VFVSAFIMHSVYLYAFAFPQNDKEGMSEQVAWSTGKEGVEDSLLELEAESGLMKRKRPELVRVTQVKQGSHRDAIRVL
jgi:hypothetical protein